MCGGGHASDVLVTIRQIILTRFRSIRGHRQRAVRQRSWLSPPRNTTLFLATAVVQFDKRTQARNPGTSVANAIMPFGNISHNCRSSIRERLLSAMRHSGPPLPRAKTQFESVTCNRRSSSRERSWPSQARAIPKRSWPPTIHYSGGSFGIAMALCGCINCNSQTQFGSVSSNLRNAIRQHSWSPPVNNF